MWYHGRAEGLEHDEAMGTGSIGLAMSDDGVVWRRGDAEVQTMSDGSAESAGSDVGAILNRSADWWTFDTCHVGQPHVQLLSSGAVSAGGGGVYWMFYSGGDFSPSAGGTIGVRTRPGLALSQDGCGPPARPLRSVSSCDCRRRSSLRRPVAPQS